MGFQEMDYLRWNHSIDYIMSLFNGIMIPVVQSEPEPISAPIQPVPLMPVEPCPISYYEGIAAGDPTHRDYRKGRCMAITKKGEVYEWCGSL